MDPKKLISDSFDELVSSLDELRVIIDTVDDFHDAYPHVVQLMGILRRIAILLVETLAD